MAQSSGIKPHTVPSSVRNAPILKPGYEAPRPAPPAPVPSLTRQVPPSDLVEVEIDGAIVEFPASMGAEQIDLAVRRMRGPQEQPSLMQRVIPTAMRVVPTVAGGVLGAIGGPIGVAAGGALGAGMGEYAAELYEQDTNQRQTINPTQVAVQTGLGAIPLGRTPGAGATVERLLQYANTIAARRAAQGAALGAGSAVATNLAEHGELPSASQLVVPGAFGAVTGGVAGRLERAPLVARAQRQGEEEAIAAALERLTARTRALPPGPRFVGQESGPVAPLGTVIPMEQAPDGSYVRSVRGEYPQRDVRGLLPPAPPPVRFVAGEAGPAMTTEQAAAARVPVTEQTYPTQDAAIAAAGGKQRPKGTKIVPLGKGQGFRVVFPAGASAPSVPVSAVDPSGGGSVPAAVVDREYQDVTTRTAGGQRRVVQKLVPTQYSGDPNAVDAPLVDLTRQENRELRRMAAEMANLPFVSRTWVEAPKKSGNAGDYDIIPGSAGASVYTDIVGQQGRATRGEVLQAIHNLFRGKLTPNGANALDVARRRLSGELRGELPPDAGDSYRLPWEDAAPGPPIEVRRLTGLPSQQASVQEQVASAVEANPHAFVNLYRERFGNVVGADNAKELFPEYAASSAARTANDLAVHRPASAVAQAVYRNLLAEPAPEGKIDLVLFTAGGTGAGKTSGVHEVLPDLASAAHITYDSTLSDLQGAVRDIDAALAAGKQVGIAFSDRDPVEAFRSTLNRGMTEGGRPVTLNTHVRSHLRSGETFDALRERYQGEPVEFIVFGNGPSGRQVVSDRTRWGYDEHRLYAAISDVLEAERAAGRISEDFYRAVRGRGAPPAEAPAAGVAGTRGPRGAGEVPPQAERPLTPPDKGDKGSGSGGTTLYSAVDPGGLGELARKHPQFATRLGLGAGGATYGYATGEDDQDRLERAALFGAAGAALPSIFSKSATRPDALPPQTGARTRASSGQPAIRFTDRSPMPRAGAIPRSRLYEFPSLQKQPEGVRDEIAGILEQHSGFSAQRRGVQSWERTQAMAERIAVPLRGLRPGTTLNAEELAAYRDALASVMTARQDLAAKIRRGDATDVDKLRFAKLTDEGVTLVANFRGAKAEAGRALNILRAKARVLEFGDSALIEQAIKAPNFDGDLKHVADVIAKAGDDPVKQLDALKELAGGTLSQKLQAAYYNSLLSGVKTHLRNFIGNSANAVANLVTPIGAAPIDAARSALMGVPREVYLREMPEGVVATFTALPQALRDFTFTLTHGYTPATVSQAAAGVFDTPRVEVPGGALTNWPSRLLEASDALFRSLARNQELYMGAYAAARRGRPSGDLHRMAELIAGTGAESEALRRRADEFARRAVFQEDPGAAINYLLQIKSNPKVHPAIRTAATFVAPFMRTPSNILRQGLEASPIGFTMPAAKQGGREGAQAMGRAAIGSAALVPLAYMAATGRLSGNGPTDPGERAALLEKGWQANSIKINGHWVRYQLLQPLSVPAAAVANAFERFQEGDRTDRAAEEAVGQAVAGAAASLLDQSFLAGLNGLLDAISDPERNAQQFLSVFAQGLVPGSGLLRNVTQAIDPKVRRPEGVREAVKTIIPALSQTVPAKQTRFGEDVERQGGPIRRGFTVPEVSTEKSDAVADALSSLGITPQIPRARLQRGGREIALNREQEQTIVKAIGQARRRRLAPIIGSRSFQQLPEDGRRRLLEDQLSDVTRDVNGIAAAQISRNQPITVEMLVNVAAR